MNNPPFILTEEFATLTAAVKTALGLGVLNYQYGYLSELQEVLKEYSKTNEFSAQKYPLIWLEQPFTIDRVDSDYFGDTVLRIFIIVDSDSELRAGQRMDQMFKPVLYPIYHELLNQIENAVHIFHCVKDNGMPHKVTDRYYWGEEQTQIFNDVFDCMEVAGLKLKIKNKPGCDEVAGF